MDYLNYWSLFAPPFGRHAARRFFAASVQREAVARLHTLVAGRLTSGVLLSPSGCGMTTLLRHVADSSGFGDCAVEMLMTRGDQNDRGQVWRDLADAMRLGYRSADLAGQIESVIDAGSRQSVRTVWLIDQAGPKATAVARQLLDRDREFSVVMGTDPQAANRLAISLGYCPLRIELPAWPLSDTIDFIHDALRTAGATRDVFSDPAIVRLHEIGEGRVGIIASIAELALVIAASQHLGPIGPEVVEAVQEELIRAA